MRFGSIRLVHDTIFKLLIYYAIINFILFELIPIISA